MKAKLIIPIVVVLLALGAGYKLVLAKTASAGREPKVHGTPYVLGKEFLINLADQRYAKLTVALVLAHGDTSTAAADGHGVAPEPPDGYGPMGQESLVRAIVTEELTNARDTELIDHEGRERLQQRILKSIKRKTDVRAKEVLFPDVTVQ